MDTKVEGIDTRRINGYKEKECKQGEGMDTIQGEGIDTRIWNGYKERELIQE